MSTLHKLPKFLLKEQASLINAKSLVGPVLDIGCSDAERSKQFAHTSFVSFDILNKFNPTITGDAHKLPFKNKSIQTTLCLSILEHVERADLVLSEVTRVLKIGGFLIITAPFLYPKHDWQDFCRFTENYFIKNLKNYRIIETKKQFSGLFSTIASWTLPSTYDLPILPKTALQLFIRTLLLFTRLIDVKKTVFYAHIFVKAQKLQ